jgi:Big-like domain-containing protein
MLTATVTSVGPTVPTGRVIFKNGGTTVGSAALSGGVARLNRNNLPVGTLSITATYNGDTQSAKSTSLVLIQVVNPASTKH